MSNSYVDGKVREALLIAKGSRSVTQKLLITWAVQDSELLRGMAEPFLKAIVGAAVDRAGRPPAAPPRPASSLSKEALQRVLSRMGEAESDSESAPETRPTAAVAPPTRTAAKGAGHEKSMMAIAKAFAAKKTR